MLQHLIKSFLRPKEIRAIFNLKYEEAAKKKPYSSKNISTISRLEKKEFCYAILHKVSRSFASVIQQLPEEVRDVICVFYLVLRGLDSIEDDMSIPREEKRKLLTNFYEKNFDREWHLNQVGDGEGYRLLLERYEHVSFFFNCLEPRFQEVITDICLEMGQGMSQYLDREITTIDDYNLYCHYVAGLVGVGLTRIFALSGLEKEDLSNDPELSNSMGLFLQKTNIIRDIHEDLGQGRTFWPAEVWNKYTDQQEQLLAQPVSDQSLFCLNHLVTEALRHSTDCLEYLSKIRNLQIFKFCAIPQVMAIATLNEIYNNPWVFKKNVKIRKGLAARLIMETCSIDDVRSVFKEMAMNIFKKISIGDPNCEETVSQLSLIIHSESSQRLTAPSANHVVKSFSTT